MMKNVSVIICTFNKKEHLILTLKSYENIYRNVYKDFEVIICNDGGDDIYKFIQGFKFSYKIRYVNLPHTGRAYARNFGVNLSDANIILFNDDDVLINPQCFVYHLQIHNKISNSVVLGNYKQVYLSDAELKNEINSDLCIKKYSTIAQDDMHETYTKNIIFNSKQHSQHWICGSTGNLSLSRESFLKLSGFDVSFKGWGYEDIEFAYRLYQHNMIFYCNINYSNFHVDHYRDKKNMITDIKKNILYFYNKHNRALEVSWYWDFLRGTMSLNEFDKRTFNELENEESNIIYPGLKRLNLDAIK